MATILYYRGEGTKYMAGIREYIVLLDYAPVDQGDIDGHAAPGFECIQQVFIPFDWPLELPVEMPLIPR